MPASQLSIAQPEDLRFDFEPSVPRSSFAGFAFCPQPRNSICRNISVNLSALTRRRSNRGAAFRLPHRDSSRCPSGMLAKFPTSEQSRIASRRFSTPQTRVSAPRLVWALVFEYRARIVCQHRLKLFVCHASLLQCRNHVVVNVQIVPVG